MAAIDPWADYRVGLDSPARHAVAVVPHDADEFAVVARRIYVGGLGNVTLLTAEDETVLFTAVPAGTWLDVQTRRVNATGTTATVMVAVY